MSNQMTEKDLPAHKGDIAAAQRIVDAGMPEIEPIIGGILGWLQDYNWPVAKVLDQAFLGMGEEIVPHIKEIFESDDSVWKYWIIVIVVPKLSLEAQVALRAEIDRISKSPTNDELVEEVAAVATEYLRSI